MNDLHKNFNEGGVKSIEALKDKASEKE